MATEFICHQVNTIIQFTVLLGMSNQEVKKFILVSRRLEIAIGISTVITLAILMSGGNGLIFISILSALFFIKSSYQDRFKIKKIRDNSMQPTLDRGDFVQVKTIDRTNQHRIKIGDIVFVKDGISRYCRRVIDVDAYDVEVVVDRSSNINYQGGCLITRKENVIFKVEKIYGKRNLEAKSTENPLSVAQKESKNTTDLNVSQENRDDKSLGICQKIKVALENQSRGEHEQAISELTSVIQEDGNKPHYYYFRALSRKNIGDIKGSIEDLDSAINLPDEDSLKMGKVLGEKRWRCYAERGLILSKYSDSNDEIDKAESDLVFVINTNPSCHGDIHFALAKTWQNMGFEATKSCKKQLNQALQKFSNDLDFYTALYLSKDISECNFSPLDEFNPIVNQECLVDLIQNIEALRKEATQFEWQLYGENSDLDEDEEELLKGIFDAKLSQNDIEGATQAISRLIEDQWTAENLVGDVTGIKGLFLSIFLRITKCHWKTLDNSAIIRDYRSLRDLLLVARNKNTPEGIKFANDYQDAVACGICCYLIEGEFILSAEKELALVEIGPESSLYSFYCRLVGLVNLHLGKYAQSIQSFDESIRTNPRDCLSLKGRSKALLSVARNAEAWTDCDLSIKYADSESLGFYDVNKYKSEVYAMRALASFELGNNVIALQDCSKSLELMPDNKEAKDVLDKINIAKE